MSEIFSSLQVSNIEQPITRLDQRASAIETPDQPAEADERASSPQSGLNMGRSLGQILLILVVTLVLVNIPVND